MTIIIIRVPSNSHNTYDISTRLYNVGISTRLSGSTELYPDMKVNSSSVLTYFSFTFNYSVTAVLHDH